MTTTRLRFGLFLLGLLAIGCGTQESARHERAERYPRLETVEPVHANFPVKIELTASVEPFEKADLCARVPGVVADLAPDIDIGRRVTAGEKLLRLDVPDLDAEHKNKEALLEQARKQKQQVIESQNVAAKELEESQEQEKRYKAEHTYRKDQHQRTSQLVERGALQPERATETRSQLEAAEAGWRAARVQIGTRQAKLQALAADLDVADSRIKVAEAELKRLAVMVNYATIRAPFNGIITRRWLDRGATIKDAGAVLLTVMNIDTVRVLLDVPERDVPLVNATEQNPNSNGQGDPVVLRIPALRGTVPNGEFAGTITRMASALDSATRTMRVEMHLDNKAGHLRPGMFGTATVLLDERYNRLLVPSTALVRRGNDTEIYYVSDVSGNPPRGVAKVAKVELGLDNGRTAEIRGGLPENVAIIAKSSSLIREGDTIIPVVTKGWEP